MDKRDRRCEGIGARTGRVYGWIYKGKIEGVKKEGGQVLIPAVEMTRLLELHKAGKLDHVMWHAAQKAGAKVGGKRRAPVKLVNKAVDNCDRTTARIDAQRPFAPKSADKRREAVQQALKAATEPRVAPLQIVAAQEIAQQEGDLRKIAADCVDKYNLGLLPITDHDQHLMLLTRCELSELVRWTTAAQSAASRLGMRVMLV